VAGIFKRLTGNRRRKRVKEKIRKLHSNIFISWEKFPSEKLFLLNSLLNQRATRFVLFPDTK